MTKLLTIVGARPQFIKAAALSRVLQEDNKNRIQDLILHTGQHYDSNMSEIFFAEMQIPKPVFKLDIGSGSHGAQTGRMLGGIEEIILKEKPDGVLVYGDTNSTLAGALAGAKLHVPVIHVEAGLRSFNKRMPEEINRVSCDHMSTLLFTPTETGIRNLKREGIVHHPQQKLDADHPGVYHCGDVMYDNTLFYKKLAEEKSDILNKLGFEEEGYFLATMHRPSNTDDPKHLADILHALAAVAERHNAPVLLPLHPRTRAIIERRKDLQLPPDDRLRLLPPASFLDMIRLEAGARLILTDSGGVQKEAWFLEKAVVVMRDETEWVEIIEAGNGRLSGPDPAKIVDAAAHFMAEPPVRFPPIFGKGQAARQILDVIGSANWR
ncbi:MAG: UDP-N-acetylglucosamine 2-epimerase (non-hydrolyzing) [Bacteroidetes bacterium]|nr:MAG: UDP-N-acetylglucosamine 2-epimerase (non-hydrolyzing) [Bacteroidota bacterium]